MLKISTALFAAGIVAAAAEDAEMPTLSDAVSLFAPTQWKHLSHFPVIPDASKPVKRMLKGMGKAKDQYMPSNTTDGFITINLFEAPDCDINTQGAAWGFRTGTCFYAVDGTPKEDHIVGSWKVGTKTASSGNEHVHVEVYDSTDCTGVAHRGKNQLSRIHYLDGQAVPTSNLVQSRHFFHFRSKCYNLHWSEGPVAPIGDACVSNRQTRVHCSSGACEIGSPDVMFYSVWTQQTCPVPASTCGSYFNGDTDDYVANGDGPGNTEQVASNAGYDAWRNMIFHKNNNGAGMEASSFGWCRACELGYTCPLLTPTGPSPTVMPSAPPQPPLICSGPLCMHSGSAKCAGEACACLGHDCYGSGTPTSLTATCAGGSCGCKSPGFYGSYFDQCVLFGSVDVTEGTLLLGSSTQGTLPAGGQYTIVPGQGVFCQGAGCKCDWNLGPESACYCEGPDCNCLQLGGCYYNGHCKGPNCVCHRYDYTNNVHIPGNDCVIMGVSRCETADCAGVTNPFGSDLV